MQHPELVADVRQVLATGVRVERDVKDDQGRSFFLRIRNFAPHAALVDVGLPGIDGFEVARRVRALSKNQDVTLIALTGRVRCSPREAGQAGAAPRNHRQSRAGTPQRDASRAS